ncbi:MAG: UDP-N-acetylglucosamine 2-epimerase [Verrucomicrobiota bacterium]|nr:UDP-N-acetylglucosamine 2-epimerase [Verrucomicrobiota bacterium]
MNTDFEVSECLLDKLSGDSRPIHLVLIATKPDIIKQAPLIMELRRRNANLVIIHSGQHYDWNLSKGMEQEFGIIPDVNLNVRSETLHGQQAQIIDRFGSLILRIKNVNRKIIPYTYSDTTTAVAGGIASFANRIAVCHVEAGLRTLSPDRDLLVSLTDPFDTESYFERLRDDTHWRKGSYEPFPEQFDTRASAPSAGVHLAPVLLNRQHLHDEGYESRRIFVVGNPVSDAISMALERRGESRILEQYPILEKGGFIRFCVHRRENVTSKQRFKSIFLAMERLIRDGQRILLISLGATEKALIRYGYKSLVEELALKYDNFIYSPVWPSYIDVVVAMTKCRMIVTDSGSIQEEANILGVPLVTLRFNTDRPETIFAGSNILAPPIREDIVYKIITDTLNSESMQERMRQSGNLYGTQVSGKMVDAVESIIAGGHLFEWLEHQKLGFSKMDFWEKEEMEW